MADKKVLRNVLNAMIREDAQTAEVEFGKYLAELTRELLGEAKDDKCDECGKDDCVCDDKSDDDDSDEKDSDGDSDDDSDDDDSDSSEDDGEEVSDKKENPFVKKGKDEADSKEDKAKGKK